MSLPSSFLSMMRRVRASIRFAKRIIFDDLTYFVINAEELSEVHISQHLTESIISSISPAPSVRRFLAHKIAIMSMTGRCTVIIIIQRNSRKDVLDVKRRSSSNSWRSSAMDKTSIGIPNAT